MQIHEMVNYFQEKSLDFLVASRFFEKSIISSFPFHRKLISKSTSLILQMLFGAKNIHQKNILDYTSGYRIYKGKTLRKIYEKYQDNFITEPEFTYTCELLIKISKLSLRLDEVAILYDYHKKIGVSKMRILQNSYRLFLMIFNLKFRN